MVAEEREYVAGFGPVIIAGEWLDAGAQMGFFDLCENVLAPVPEEGRVAVIKHAQCWSAIEHAVGWVEKVAIGVLEPGVWAVVTHTPDYNADIVFERSSNQGCLQEGCQHATAMRPQAVGILHAVFER